jgi:hypothetical protein
VRVEQTLRRCRGEGANAGAGGRDRVTEHRVLALEIRVLDIVAPGVQIREPLDD